MVVTKKYMKKDLINPSLNIDCCNIKKLILKISKKPFKEVDYGISKEKYKILLASILVTFAYLPILYAFTKVNVPSVAALREISILFTSIYGVYFLKEKFGLIKVISAALVVVGCIIIRIAAG